VLDRKRELEVGPEPKLELKVGNSSSTSNPKPG